MHLKRRLLTRGSADRESPTTGVRTPLRPEHCPRRLWKSDHPRRNRRSRRRPGDSRRGPRSADRRHGHAPVHRLSPAREKFLAAQHWTRGVGSCESIASQARRRYQLRTTPTALVAPQPPSSTTSPPDRYDDASLARKSAVPTISSADAMRRRPTLAAMRSCISGDFP